MDLGQLFRVFWGSAASRLWVLRLGVKQALCRVCSIGDFRP